VERGRAAHLSNFKNHAVRNGGKAVRVQEPEVKGSDDVIGELSFDI
jgi:hypothetical protein